MSETWLFPRVDSTPRLHNGRTVLTPRSLGSFLTGAKMQDEFVSHLLTVTPPLLHGHFLTLVDPTISTSVRL